MLVEVCSQMAALEPGKDRFSVVYAKSRGLCGHKFLFSFIILAIYWENQYRKEKFANNDKFGVQRGKQILSGKPCCHCDLCYAARTKLRRRARGGRGGLDSPSWYLAVGCSEYFLEPADSRNNPFRSLLV
jgi:hypothetical protein